MVLISSVDDEKFLVGLDRETEELLLVKSVEGLDEDLFLRTSLITSYVIFQPLNSPRQIPFPQ